MSKKAFWLQGKGPEANFKRDHFLLIFKNDRPECSEIERKKKTVRGVRLMSLAKHSFYKNQRDKMRFEQFLKRKIYIEYVINLLGVRYVSVVL